MQNLRQSGKAEGTLSKQQATRIGVPPERAQQILTGSLFDGRVHKAYGQKIVDRRYTPPGMTVPLAMKDLRLLLAEAEHSNVPMPLTSLLHDRLVAAQARGWSGFGLVRPRKTRCFRGEYPTRLKKPAQRDAASLIRSGAPY